MHMQKEPSRAMGGVAFDEKALIASTATTSAGAVLTQPGTPAATNTAAAAGGGGGGELHQCLLCERAYHFKADLEIHHMKRHAPASGVAAATFKCTVCDNVYATPEDLAFHLKKRHNAYDSSRESMSRSATLSTSGNTMGTVDIAQMLKAANAQQPRVVVGVGESGAGGEDVLALLGGRRSRASVLLGRSVTQKKLNLGAGEQFVPVNIADDEDDDDGDGTLPRTPPTTTSTPSVALTSTTTSTPLKAEYRKSVIVQRNPNRVVLTIVVPK
jgi:hypothetical protein